MDDGTKSIGYLTLIIGGGLIGLIVLWLVAGPNYGVWSQGKAGEAKLREAESSRQIRVLEAKAKKESASLEAEAEVERAKGVAQANQIIGDSLKGNSAYLQYLYIKNLEEQPGDQRDRTIIYVPTEGGMPIPSLLEAGRATTPLQAPPIPVPAQ